MQRNETQDRDASADELLQRGRHAYAERAWADAAGALSKADQLAPLDADDLERMGLACALTGDSDGLLKAQERAHHVHLQAGRNLRAARLAFWIGYRLMPLGEPARAQAWFARAQRIVESTDQDCPERGFMLLPGIMRRLFEGDCAQAHADAVTAAEIGERFHEPDLIALARLNIGRALLKQGQLEQGLSLLDEVMLTAGSRELSPHVSGLVYCLVISACSQVYALDRAREWTAALSTWCEAQPQLVTFAGACLVHRAEVMELRGDWSDCIEEARRAEQRLATGSDPRAAADALYQQAEIHRLRGEHAEAEEAYAHAGGAGREPLPGLALLRFSQGRAEAALSAMRRVVATTRDPLARARYLPAHIEILLAAGELEEARVASDELSATAKTFGTDVLRAMAEQSRGAVLLARGSADAAVEPLRSALLIWCRIGAPYIVARLHVLLGRACRELGDEESAQREWDGAQRAFVQLGAAPDQNALAALRTSKRAVPSEPAPKDGSHGLSARELQVLRLVAAGKTNRAIATELFLSEKTVDRHVSNIFVKTNVASRAAATAFAYENKLI